MGVVHSRRPHKSKSSPHIDSTPVVNRVDRAPSFLSHPPIVRAPTGVDIIANPQTSQPSLSFAHKGLYNSIGLHHCFLNVCIQSLWHLRSFRNRFLADTSHKHNVEPCIYCGLRQIFMQYMHSDELILPPDVLRQALAQQYTAPTLHIHTEPTATIHVPTSVPTKPVVPVSPMPNDIDSGSPIKKSKSVDDIDEFLQATQPTPPAVKPAPQAEVIDNNITEESHVTTRFAINEQADAEEALDVILKWLHCDNLGMINIDADSIDVLIDKACEPMCISHSVFGENIVDMRKCKACGATSDPETTASFLYRVYVSELLEMKDQYPQHTLTRQLKHIIADQTYACPSNGQVSDHGHTIQCKGEAHIIRYSLSVPKVFVLMLAWPSDEVERDDLECVMRLISMRISLDDFLMMPQPDNSNNSSQDVERSHQYDLCGILLYYGRHYVCVFYSRLYAGWLMFDDRKVTKLGTWSNVIDKCVRGKLQPITIFYEQAASAIPAHAPHNSVQPIVHAASVPTVVHNMSPYRATSANDQSVNAGTRRR